MGSVFGFGWGFISACLPHPSEVYYTMIHSQSPALKAVEGNLKSLFFAGSSGTETKFHGWRWRSRVHSRKPDTRLFGRRTFGHDYFIVCRVPLLEVARMVERICT